MDSLPSALRARLRAAPRVVVAPVGVGFGQQNLREWAARSGYRLVHQSHDLTSGQVLWCPTTRSELRALPQHVALHEILVVDEHLARLDFETWAAALENASPEWQRLSYAQSDGWPAALPLAASLAPQSPRDFARHPLVQAYLDPILPPDPLRATYTRLAVAPLIIPALYPLLGVDAQEVGALYDAGWLNDEPGGFSIPRLVRHTLGPHVDPARAEVISRTLTEMNLEDAALDVLAEGGAWEAYLNLLASRAKAGTGEDVLRHRLRPIPEAWRDRPSYQYLAGLLARIHGEVQHAEGLYRTALREASNTLAPLVHNALGVILAMQQRTDEALQAFEAATSGPSITAGEAWHNRAALLTHLARYTEAEQSLREAVSAFRAAGDEAREARSLSLLGTLYTKRGLFREAVHEYEEAVKILERGSHDPDVYTFLNLAEVYTLLGQLHTAERYLKLARTSTTDPRALGWLARNTALLDLQRGRLEAAQSALTTLLSGQPTDRLLIADAQLLLAHVLRERGEPEAAREHLRHAVSLGLRAQLEEALLTGAGLDEVIEHARADEARYELAVALVARGGEADVREALDLTRTHGYAALLEGPEALKLAAQAQDDPTSRDLFPVKLSLLGPLTVRFAGRDHHLSDFPTRKSAALLLALAFAQRPTTREELAERFWPDAKNAMGSLQTAVYHLRGVLGVPVVRSERGLLSLAFPVQSDVSRLNAALKAAQAEAADALTEVMNALREAGPFLPEFPDDFEEERDSAQAQLREARWLLARASASGSDVQRDALRALIADDPYDLEARSQLASFYDVRGDHEAAVQERRRLAELEREFG